MKKIILMLAVIAFLVVNYTPLKAEINKNESFSVSAIDNFDGDKDKDKKAADKETTCDKSDKEKTSDCASKKVDDKTCDKEKKE